MCRYTLVCSESQWGLSAAETILENLANKEMPFFWCQIFAWAVEDGRGNDIVMFSFEDKTLNPRDRNEVMNHPLLKHHIEPIQRRLDSWEKVDQTIRENFPELLPVGN
jgi:hypothetical protein